MWEGITKKRHSDMLGGRLGDLILLNKKCFDERGEETGSGEYYAEALIRKNRKGRYMAYVWNDLRSTNEDAWGRWILVGRFKRLQKAKEKTKNRLILELL